MGCIIGNCGMRDLKLWINSLLERFRKPDTTIKLSTYNSLEEALQAAERKHGAKATFTPIDSMELKDGLIEALVSNTMSLLQEKRYAEARADLEEALQLTKECFGSDHLSVARVLNCLAHSYVLESNNLREPNAQQLYMQALTICEKSLGERKFMFTIEDVFSFKESGAIALVGTLQKGMVERGEPVVVHTRSGHTQSFISQIDTFANGAIPKAETGQQVALIMQGVKEDDPMPGDIVVSA